MKKIDEILKEFDVSTTWDSFFVKDWLPEELFIPIKNLIVESYVNGKGLRYDEKFGRWTSDIDFSVLPNYYLMNHYVQQALKPYDDEWDQYTLQGHFGWKYESVNGKTPKLEPHIDSYGGNIIFDICLESTIDWDIIIGDKTYHSTKPNEVIVFNGQTLMHSRPDWNMFSSNESDYVIVMFFVASKQNHWSRVLGIEYLDVFKKIQYLSGLNKNNISEINIAKKEIELMYNRISNR